MRVWRRAAAVVGLLVLLSVGLAAPAAACDLSGQWRSNFGILTLQQPGGGSSVAGSFRGGEGTIALTGTLQGQQLDFTLLAPPSYAAGGGSGSLTADADCRRLTGHAALNGGEDTAWTAARLTQDSVASDAVPLDRLVVGAAGFAAIQRILDGTAALIPAVPTPASILAAVGSDAEMLTAWVAQNTRLVPYRGTLKGPEGVLQESAGNSLDRARLLASLLQQAGRSVRLAHATLDGPQLQRAETEALQVDSLPGLPTLPTASALLALVTAEPILGALPVDSLLQDRTQQDDAVAAKRDADLGTVTAALLRLVGPPPAVKPDLEALTDHWWVQVDAAGAWQDLDPSGIGGDLTATETFAPDALPPELWHRVTLSLSLEVWNQGGLRTVPLLSHDFAVADLLGQSLTLMHWPMHAPRPVTLDEAIQGTFERAQALAVETDWVPVLQLGEQSIVDQRFDLLGNARAFDLSDLAPSNAELMRESNSGSLGGIGGALTGETPAPPPRWDDPAVAQRVTAEWLDITVTAPGEPPRHECRAIFDLLGPAARAAGAEPHIDQALHLRRVQALAGVASILIAGSENSPLTTLQNLFAGTTQVAGSLAAALETAAGGGTEDPPDPPAGAELGLVQQIDVARFDWDHRAGFRGRANLLLFWTYPAVGDPDATQARQAIDLVLNDAASLPQAADGAFGRALAQGVRDTLAESLVLHGAGESTNVAVLHSKALEAGTDWRLLRDSAAVQALALDEDLKARLAADLSAGYWVVAPQAPVDVAGAPAGGWWRIDPASGTTLGFLANGTGGDMTEEAAANAKALEEARIGTLKSAKIWIRFATTGTCLLKLTGELMSKGKTNMAAAALCVASALSSMCADTMSAWDILKLQREVLSVIGLVLGLLSTWTGILVPS